MVYVRPKRGFVYRITLNYIDKPAEFNKKHMVVVIQNNDILKLKWLREVNVLEITSNLKNIGVLYNVSLPAKTLTSQCQPTDSKIKCHALYGVKIEDLLNGEYCGKVPSEIMKKNRRCNYFFTWIVGRLIVQNIIKFLLDRYRFILCVSK